MGLRSELYRQLASLKLTVFILLALAASSLVGTLLPQDLAGEELSMRYSPAISRLIDFFGLNDLYHTGWFRFLILLLCVNLIVCTLERLPKTLKVFQHTDQEMEPAKLLKFANHAELTTPLLWEEVAPAIERVTAKEFGSLVRFQKSGVFSATAEKGRWSLLMVYVVHFSVLVVLLGALMGSILGFKGFMNIPEGQTMSEAHMAQGHGVMTLPFQVRCDRFDVSYYDTGAPKEYLSDLTIIDNGKETLKRSIRVNDPLTYKGITFYQASYGATLKKAEVEFTDASSGKVYPMELKLGETATIPDTKDEIQIVQYKENFSRLGPALAIALLRKNEEPVGSWIIAGMPEFHGNRIGSYRVRVLHTEQTRFTGLQVKEDPGIWFVWLGFTALVIGIGATFYSSHRRIWVWASAGNPATRVVIAGRTNKNSLSFEREFGRLCERLQDELKAHQRGQKK